MVWRPDGPEGNEAGKIKYLAVPYTRGYGLDIGCGPWKAFPHFIGIDSLREWNNGTWRPDIAADGTKLQMFASDVLDFVFSSHFLEHVHNPGDVLLEWWRVLKPGGHLVLYLPHAEFYPRMGQPGANPDHKSDFRPDDVVALMRGVAATSEWGWTLVENEDRNGGAEYSFFQVYRKAVERGDACVEAPWRKPDKACLVVRYGAFGDQIIAASVLPLLKEQGYHITYQTTPRGKGILKHNPHIDAWWIQDTDQVPNEELGPFWQACAQRYDRVINLSESIEGSLLAMPGRLQHAWPHDIRHRVLNVNYLERTHDLAGVPHRFDPRFHPSAEEIARSERERKLYGKEPVVLWVLAGSSIHKSYPWADRVIARLLLRSDAKIITVGDRTSQILEIGICQELLHHGGPKLPYEESHKMKLSQLLGLVDQHYGKGRLICRAGAWNIRDTMTFARMADCVVGPETGVLNAVSFEDVPKVVLLSHSSHENLTKHWKNTIAVEPPPSVACYPCHRMHYTREHCPEDENTGAAKCAAAIRPADLADAISEQLLMRGAPTGSRVWVPNTCGA